VDAQRRGRGWKAEKQVRPRGGEWRNAGGSAAGGGGASGDVAAAGSGRDSGRTQHAAEERSGTMISTSGLRSKFLKEWVSASLDVMSKF
jgi:hypothetical protein